MNKWLLRTLMVIFILLSVSIVGGYFIFNNYQLDYDEDITIDGIQEEVNIYYDQYAIPHIYANNIGDAYRALGYAHAKDRLWQIDLIRRIAPGRLSEIFGASTLETDRFFRTIGLGQQSKNEALAFKQRATGDLKEMVYGYIAGINQFIIQGKTTVEHRILGITMEPYTLEDVYNVIGYMSFSFSMAHKTEPIIDFINSSLGAEYLKDLDVQVAKGTQTIDGYRKKDISDLSLMINDIVEGLPAPEMIGSNSWVIGPGKSTSGGVLFANDPHIGFSQPSVWYEAHVETPDFTLYGYHIAGFPLAQIGHNRHHAIGLTMFENDDIDYYRERINPDNADQYWAIDKWQELEVRDEVIKVKDAKTDTMQVRSTRHGPILSDVLNDIDDTDPISMWWVYQQFPLRQIEASHILMNSKTMEEIRIGASMIHAPGLNVMYGDVDGNIAWWGVAKLPKRPDHVNSKLILDGASGNDDVLGYYDFDDNPQAINPPEGFVYSANNQSLSHDSIRHPGYYLPEDRARRIVHLLSEKDDWNMDDMKAMQNDVTSDNVSEIIASLSSALSNYKLEGNSPEVYELLTSWNGRYGMDDIAPTIYTKLIYHIMHEMMSDELGYRWETFNGNHVMKRSIQPLIANTSSVWWDDVTTDQKESRQDIIIKSFSNTISELENQLGENVSAWQWSRVHTLEHPHAFDSNPSIRSYFNVGPFPVSGSTEVINNLQFTSGADGIYKVAAGPSTRRAIDMSDVNDASWSILPTGQSGNVLSPHYKDQALMYVQGLYRKQLLDKDEILESHKYHSVLSAR